MRTNKSIALDIGGSHITAALVDLKQTGRQSFPMVRSELDAFADAGSIMHAIGNAIQQMVDSEIPSLIGIAFPGPFIYDKGIAAIGNVGGKFKHIFGLHVKEALRDMSVPENAMICFSNDAHCFAVGANTRYLGRAGSSLFLTLGTGLGAAYMKDGELVKKHPVFGPGDGLFDHSYADATADDYFSSRWFLREAEKNGLHEIKSVKQLAESKQDVAVKIFEDFGANLGSFLRPVMEAMSCNSVVIGGNIARASPLFHDSLCKAIALPSVPVTITYTNDTEECILTGAALLADKEHHQRQSERSRLMLRRATQPLLPIYFNKTSVPGYDVFPAFESGRSVSKGFDNLAAALAGNSKLIIDGYGGVLWEEFREQLHEALVALNRQVFWFSVDACLKSPATIDNMIAESINGDDPVFGKKHERNLADFFIDGAATMIRPIESADLCILYGTGAAICDWEAPLVYVDLPKNEIQYRMRAGSITNLGSDMVLDTTQMYKRFYFVDWPVLNKHKQALIGKIDFIVDEQRINEITWMKGNDFRQTLDAILSAPFRARPWFEAGVWGGHWMKKNIKGLNENEVNYAWSFELITPENGIVIEGNHLLLEISFDSLLYYDNKALMGRAAKRFDREFPIRFDFLDTYVGANLSIQCHPRTEYIRDHFGEKFTQDETYYILDCEPDAKVYLGFQEDIDPVRFKKALTDAQQYGVELPVEDYVQKHKAHKHELFLIPNATIHASGKNNFVLEISSTPYIFTFKMYDWLRLGLNGQPRPINIEHAFHNLDFDRKGSYVAEQLISTPVIMETWEQGRLLKLPTHELHFYTIDRYEFRGKRTITTNGHFHICMLVEGDAVEVLTGSVNTRFSYAETFVIPAAVSAYEVTYTGAGTAFLVVAYIKDECC